MSAAPSPSGALLTSAEVSSRMPRESRLPPTIRHFDGCPVQESPGPSSLRKDLGVARDPQLEPAVQDWAVQNQRS